MNRLPVAWILGALLAAAPAHAQFLIVDVKTNFGPYEDFVGIVSTLTKPDDASFRRTPQQQLVPSADVPGFMTPTPDGAFSIRAAEFFDLAAGDYTLEVKLIDGSGAALATRRSAVLLTANLVVTMLFADTRVAPNGTAEKSARLLNDNDGDGRVSPGDHLRYTVELNGRGATEFRDALSCGGHLLAGSVTTTHGTVTEGNRPGNTVVVVSGLALDGVEPATVTFDVEVVPYVSNQGRLRFSGGDLLTDNPATAGIGDATVTPVSCSFATCAGDNDGDGVANAADACAKTPSGETVDARGCSLVQFCASIPAGTGKGELMCRNADWRSDEPVGMPRDCQPVAGTCVVR